MQDPTPRVLGMLVGNVSAPGSGAQIKYGQLFAALAQQCRLVDVADAELYGADRYQNALRNLRWPLDSWREAVRKNVWAFHQRSRKARTIVRRYAGRIDAVLQHGAIFRSDIGQDGPPVVIYTDFTYQLAAREDPWRNPFTRREGRRWDALERAAYHSAALVLTRSEHARRSLLSDYEVAPERVITVGGGVNFAELPPPQPLADSPRLLFIGKEFERKGGPVLLAAFALVREQFPEAELCIVTADEQAGGPGVTRIAPTHDRETIARLYRESSMFVMPSRCETWGDVFLEAMAYGLPCVGTTNDAMPEIIQHGTTGYVEPADNPIALAGALSQLLRDADLRRRMGAAGRARVAAQFTWPHVAGQIVAAIERVAQLAPVTV